MARLIRGRVIGGVRQVTLVGTCRSFEKGLSLRIPTSLRFGALTLSGAFALATLGTFGSVATAQPATAAVAPASSLCTPVESAAQDGDLTLGVISDTHVTQWNTTTQARTKQAFEAYSNGVLASDALVIDGDLTDGGSKGEFDVFKSIKDEALTIPLIASMGNHENNQWANFEAATGQRANDCQIVGGYHVITVSPGSGELDPATGRATGNSTSNYAYAVDFLKAAIAEAEAATPDRPIFVFFHHPIKDTFYVADEWYGYGLDNVLNGHNRVVSFSGHIHTPNQHPQSIWQDGGYTAVNTVTLYYYELERGMVYGSIPPNSGNAAQGLQVNVNGSQVEIKNYDFISNSWIPQTWTFDVTKDLPYTEANRAPLAVAPVWDAAAAISVSDVTPTSARLTFPQATVPANEVGDIVHSYQYEFINRETGETVKTFRTWSEFYFIPQPNPFTHVAEDLAAGTKYEVRITAFDAWKKPSATQLIAEFETPIDESAIITYDDLAAGVPEADLLDVRFDTGVAVDESSVARTNIKAGTAAIVDDTEVETKVAQFTGKPAEAWIVPWSADDYALTNDGLTYATTFKVSPFSGGYVDLLGNMQSAGVGFEVSPATDGATLEAWVHVGGYKVPAGSISWDTWHTAIATYDGTEVTLYIDGVKAASKPASGLITTPGAASQAFVLGGDIDGSGNAGAMMTGSAASFQVFSEPLTAKQVLLLSHRELAATDNQAPMFEEPWFESLTTEAGKGMLASVPTVVDGTGLPVELTARILDASGNVIATDLINEVGLDIPNTLDGGNYTIEVTATDRAGNVATISTQLVVTGSLPTATPTATPTAEPTTASPTTAAPTTAAPTTAAPTTAAPTTVAPTEDDDNHTDEPTTSASSPASESPSTSASAPADTSAATPVAPAANGSTGLATTGEEGSGVVGLALALAVVGAGLLLVQARRRTN